MHARSPLFEPLTVGRLTLANRIVMAPMTRECAPGGIPTAAMAEYYRRRAAGGVGLIITEGAPPNAPGNFGARVPRFYGTDALAAWAPIVRAVKAEGAAIFAQLWHVGAFAPSLIGMADSLPQTLTRESPSGLAGPGRPLGRSMSAADIEATLGDFARAAAAARELGFDGVEIHGAHGYLPDQFLWEPTNRRDDGYGGSLEARLRFPVELVRACRAALGPALVLCYRLSQWKQLDYAARIASDPGELGTIVAALAGAGTDLLHCSTRRYWEPAFEGDPRTLATWVRDLSGRPVITVGSVTLGVDLKAPGGRSYAPAEPAQIADLEAGLAAGRFDLVAVGRALLANPDWPRLVAEGRLSALRPFEKRWLDELV